MNKNPPTDADPHTAHVRKRRRTPAAEQTPAEFYTEREPTLPWDDERLRLAEHRRLISMCRQLSPFMAHVQ